MRTYTKEIYRHYINDLLDGYMHVGTDTEVSRRNCEDRSVKWLRRWLWSAEEPAGAGDCSGQWHRMLVHVESASNSSTAHGATLFQFLALCFALATSRSSHSVVSYISNLSLKIMLLITFCCHFYGLSLVSSFCAPLMCCHIYFSEQEGTGQNSCSRSKLE